MSFQCAVFVVADAAGLSGCRSKFVLTRLEHLELLTHRRCVLHHVVTINFDRFHTFWVKLPIAFQILENLFLLVNSVMHFHASRSHDISAFIISNQMFFALPVLISFGFTFPLTAHLINLFVEVLQTRQV